MISAETRAKISASLTGKIGPQSRGWKGDDAGYCSKHIWILKHYGKATKCTFNPEHKAKRYEWANISGKYLRDVSDYMQLCPSCHRKYDAKKLALVRGNGVEVCKHGHPFAEENTYIDPRGYRNCRTCISIANEKYLSRRAINKLKE